MFQENFGAREPAGEDMDGHSPLITIQPLEATHRCLSRRASEESIRTELCEGPIPDSPPKAPSPEQGADIAVSDRAELIERLKRGESPTWVPNRHVRCSLSLCLLLCAVVGGCIDDEPARITVPPEQTCKFPSSDSAAPKLYVLRAVAGTHHHA